MPLMNKELLTELDPKKVKEFLVADSYIFVVLNDGSAIRIETGIEYGEPFIEKISAKTMVVVKDRIKEGSDLIIGVFD